ncbi:uncharacterized protein LOC124636613 [Helicoverpa zea]|uniref:uncharacterized protein LOC124636613 n=1 Tax=Helicoverpa zea TaxID=7113 RepID=UPI001F562286|nr:uncharacterized protein LOC124636613 [Helicoverpa zea]
MLASLAGSSLKQYDVCLKKWFLFCKVNNFDIYEASVPTVIKFLTQIYESGAKYATINSYRSALSLILGQDLGNNDCIKRFCKGIFRLRPPLPKYDTTWDVSVVLNFLATLYPNESQNLDKLSKKLATLLALTTAHRVQTLSKINIDNIEIFATKVSIKIPDLIKTSRPGAAQPELILPFFRERPEICPVSALGCFLELTKDLRKTKNLFISINKPHKSVTSQTLSRWIKSILGTCGIDVTTFSAHSTRHASTSKAYKTGVNLDLIRKTAGWSNYSTFARFYNRNVNEIDKQDDSFARGVLLND